MLTASAAWDKGITFAVDVESEVPIDIMVDKVRLSQVINNLVGN